MKVEKGTLVDIDEGYLYGFPKVLDIDINTNAELHEWIYSNGLPKDKVILYVRLLYSSNGSDSK